MGGVAVTMALLIDGRAFDVAATVAAANREWLTRLCAQIYDAMGFIFFFFFFSSAFRSITEDILIDIDIEQLAV